MRDTVILEIIATDLRLRVGRNVLFTAVLADRAVVKLRHVGRSYAKRRRLRFLDLTTN
jgi:hypothetical protein